MQERASERILLVNDDGIHAPGLAILEAAARELSDDVWVVAPDDNRSGASHSLSVQAPMRVTQLDEKRYSVRGTPTECTLLAVHELIKDRKPTICISGINRGPNLAEDAVYSGTVAAAREATQLGIPAIALSQVFARGETHFSVGADKQIHWETAQHWVLPVLRELLQARLESGVFLNVNFPGVPLEDVRGIRYTIQGQRPPGCYIPERRVDGHGNPYYWIMLSYAEGDSHPDSDLRAIAEDYISVTPLKLDLTAYEARSALLRKSG
ncbi:MAG: 5'/3'-nucleotidase SurE [Halieaceae bacterium]|nr:5'/3'-nucleotidase SurE [Halieaceae bacterium]